jgi:hypothetical protein
MLFPDKPIDREVVGDELLIELFSAEFLLTLVLEITNDSHHQKEDAKKIQENTFVQVHTIRECTMYNLRLTIGEFEILRLIVFQL